MGTGEERSVDTDIQLVEPPILVKLASIAQAMTGVFVGLTGLQLVGTHWRAAWANYASYGLLFLGAATIGMAAMQYRARGWSAIGSMVLGVVTALSMLGWFFYVLTDVLSCVMWLAVPLSCFSVILSAVSVGPILSTAAARRRLADRGMDLGL